MAKKKKAKPAPPIFLKAAAHPFLAVVLITAAALLMWSGRGLPTEDGMIYLRYAFNLANGYGLVYNPGEYYESNTNFLWTLLLVPPFWFGWDAVTYLQVLGIALAVAVLALLYDVVRAAGGGATALLAVLLLGTHATFLFAAPSGLAPHLPALFVLAAMAFYYRYADANGNRVVYALAIGVSLSLLLITRLDAVLLFAVLLIMLLFAAILARSAHKKPATPPHRQNA